MKIYIGNYIEVLQSFHEICEVDLVVSEKRNVDERIVTYCRNQNIQLMLAESAEDLHSKLKPLDSADLCIVASFGLLLKSEFIRKTDLIVNIHPGSLMNSRGRHPLPFAIKKGLPFMSLTAHLIEDEKIDNGPVVAEWNIPIDYSGTYEENDRRLRSILPFITAYILKQYINNNIYTASIDLSKAKYNLRLTADELGEMMQAKDLKKYNIT